MKCVYFTTRCAHRSCLRNAHQLFSQSSAYINHLSHSNDILKMIKYTCKDKPTQLHMHICVSHFLSSLSLNINCRQQCSTVRAQPFDRVYFSDSLNTSQLPVFQAAPSWSPLGGSGYGGWPKDDSPPAEKHHVKEKWGKKGHWEQTWEGRNFLIRLTITRITSTRTVSRLRGEWMDRAGEEQSQQRYEIDVPPVCIHRVRLSAVGGIDDSPANYLTGSFCSRE